MRRPAMRGTGLLAAATIVLAACGDGADTTTDIGDQPTPTEAGTEASELPDVPTDADWALAANDLCVEYHQLAGEATAPIFEAEGEPDPEAVREVFVSMAPEVAKVRDAVADAAPPEGEAAARDAWLSALDAQVTTFEAAAEDADAAMALLQELSGPFTPESGAAADEAGAWVCGTGNTFAEAEFTDQQASAAARVEVTGIDYAFEVPTELAAGDHVLEFRNEGGEDHEMILVSLADDWTYDDAMAWLEENADVDEEPPFMQSFHGAFAGVGGRADVNVTFEPGTWMMICFLPAPDEMPHFAKGMHAEITVA